MFVVPALPLLDTALDLTLLALVAVLLLLSSLSFAFVVHLRLKSRSAPHLGNFNSLWTVRLLLISATTLWALVEVLRVPFFRRRYLAPFLPFLTQSQQADVCKFHVVLSLGLCEPVFLLTLLFLVNVSIKKKDPRRLWALAFVFGGCLPLLLLQIVFLFYDPIDLLLPEVFRRSSYISKDEFGNDTVLCTYPLTSTIVFGAFGVTYSLCFLLSCWKVMSLVINKGLRTRIYVLAAAILVSLPLEILLLGVSTMWTPDRVAYKGMMFGVFLCTLACTTAGEGILVIRPIIDALAAGGECCQWSPNQRLPQEEDRTPQAEEMGVKV
ncbi:uncharacterized protein LOC115754286 [Rhodamnia argentea]|uniref:Uncharacterized protein LOC115754286 n=1 Tax=Rhodamnia argentea TaxID=178133 RepID=A0A8B8QPL6_9MYRT|nr:uncharacterized protein LOC115754286 [Rhodamnia argentea]